VLVLGSPSRSTIASALSPRSERVLTTSEAALVASAIDLALTTHDAFETLTGQTSPLTEFGADTLKDLADELREVSKG
jgi:hypothetical protein